ncbi:MAG TPA: hypothetical protein PJ988_15880 [Anaerolinea sp.]|nr:hypothetical protein [Anaerolinea sp.]
MSANLNPQTKRTSDAWIGGAVLVLIGAVALAANFTTLPAYLMLLVPGLALLAWGLIARHIGPVIPGCILSSLSASAALVGRNFDSMPGEAIGGIFMVSLACGFFAIALLSLYTERGRLAWWPLIPGSVLASMGGLVLGGDSGMKVLEIVSKAWPAVLILVGGYLLLRRKH